jgi:hypothetical protein
MRAVRFLILLALLCAARIAHAYPQYQLAKDAATCTGCHISPDGGGLLNENGLNVAENDSWKGHDPAFVYGTLGTPDWLQLGGELRGAAGVVEANAFEAAAYPMQGEVGARAAKAGFSVYANLGFRRPSEGASLFHVVWSREHYAMWQQKPGENSGLYVRAGRFLPTFGLCLAEHVVYTQKYGGKPLYYEAYGVGVSYVTDAAEVHATGFASDRIASAAEHGDGGALYGEYRLTEHASVGVEGKYSKADDDTRMFGGVTGKLYLPGPDVLLLGEAELIRQEINAGAGDKRTALAAYVMGSHPLPSGLLLDIGLGHYTQDTRVKGLYRDCIDANLHWFYDSHFEVLLTTRLELLDLGSGNNGGYALAQLHVRL